MGRNTNLVNSVEQVAALYQYLQNVPSTGDRYYDHQLTRWLVNISRENWYPEKLLPPMFSSRLDDAHLFFVAALPGWTFVAFPEPFEEEMDPDQAIWRCAIHPVEGDNEEVVGVGRTGALAILSATLIARLSTAMSAGRHAQKWID